MLITFDALDPHCRRITNVACTRPCLKAWIQIVAGVLIVEQLEFTHRCAGQRRQAVQLTGGQDLVRPRTDSRQIQCIDVHLLTCAGARE